jgi:phosphatidylserine/phosphatidylglycerophosphate/cardiolipin synthase-like enzyme
MRKGDRNNEFSVRAIAGTYVVTLCFDARQTYAKKLLGFAIHRKEFRDNKIYEEYWLKGYKPFEEVIKNPVPGMKYSTYEHPIQSFTWGDFSVKPGTTYEYKVVPVSGKPKKLDYDPGISIKITTESLEDSMHEIHFNRAAAASQAYAEKFDNKRPNDKSLSDNEKEIRKAWLARGLYDAICNFIKLAEQKDYKLHAALYEIDSPGVIDAFKKVADKGQGKLQIIYEARTGIKQAEDNEEALGKAGFHPGDGIIFRRKNTDGIPHNKFMVLLKDDEPVMVWTGSTNLSEGGIFGHANVGHCIKDPGLAGEYLKYWKLLKNDPDKSTLAGEISNQWPDITDLSGLSPGDMKVIFSPRKGLKELKLYADTFGSAGEMANITLPFNLDEKFLEKIKAGSDALRFVILNSGKKNLEIAEQFEFDPDVVIAPGSKMEKMWHQWLNEIHSGLNGSNVLYIHTKFLLKDPLGDKPVIITGSANFSEPSTNKNDENMVIIACSSKEGETRIQDIYLGEFFRLFDHLYFRYIATKLGSNSEKDKKQAFLKPNPAEWIPPYFNKRSDKFKRRVIFSLKPSL